MELHERTYVRAECDRTFFKMNADGTFTAHFGSPESFKDRPNRLDITEGWNFLMRVYRPGASVLNRSYKLPSVIRSN